MPPHPCSRPWMNALEAQLDAISLVNRLISSDHREINKLDSSWQVDRRLLARAAPFTWSREVIAAVIAAGASIPLDTCLNRWNLGSEAVWWYFEELLPWQTVSDDRGIRAICFGFLPTEDRTFGLPVAAWIDGDERLVDNDTGRTVISLNVSPSQTFEWGKERTFGEMLEQTRLHHRQLYGKGGRFAAEAQVGEDIFMATTERLARFVLAGMAWLNQRVLVTKTDDPVERHRRKAYERVVKAPFTGVRVVQLRRHDYAPGEPSDDDPKRAYSCRWVVGGHWRNQVCGVGRADRRLTYIHPFVKGPADQPLRTHEQTVYAVNR